MIISKCFRRPISFFLSICLVFQTFVPALVYAADDATASASLETQAKPDLAPPDITPTPPLDPSTGSNPEVPSVGEGVDYRYKDTNVVVRFTKITKPGKLTIRQIKLTPEQMATTSALSDTAYDITSDMENGSFLYDLTLPLPQNNQNAKVEFASNADSLNQPQTVSLPEEKTENTITVRGLNHFTIFFVTSGDDRATDGTWCDDPGAVCTFGGEESLKTVDGNYLDISSVTGIPGWSASYFDSQYVQFNFNHPELTGVSIANAKLKLVYKTNSIDGGYDSDAKLVISGDGNFDDPEAYEVISVKPAAATTADQPFLVQLPSQYQDSTKLTNLKIRFYLYGVADDGLVTTSFDQVVLLVNYSPPTSTFNTIDSPTNNNSPTITGTATANGGATVKNVEYKVDIGLWMPALASDGIFNFASELFKFSLSALTEGNHVFETKVTDSLDTIQTETASLNLVVDTTAPDITVPADITSEATSSLGAIVTYTSPTATDIQDGSDAVSCDKNSGATFPLGLTTVHCSSTDTAGNTTNKIFKVTVQDTTKPTKPTATPPAGDYTSDQSVTLESSDSLSGLDKIYYTTDGSTPDKTKTEYTNTITVDRDMTIKAIAYDKAGNASDILVVVYGIAPKISAETSSSSTTTSATITWTTDDPATSRVIYDTASHSGLGEAPNYGYINSTVEDSTKVTSHTVGLTGLSSGTTYYYRTVSHGSPETVSSEHSFITSSGGIGGSGVSDGKSATPSAPVCNNTKPGSAPTLLSAFGGVDNVTLKWTEAADPLTYYLITYGTKPGAQTYGNPNIGGKGTTGYTVSGLSGGITYYFQVRAGNGCAPGDFSNEISAAALGSAIPIETPAEGFAPGVKGASADLTPTPTPSIPGETNQNNFPWWFIVLLIATGGFGARLFFRRQ